MRKSIVLFSLIIGLASLTNAQLTPAQKELIEQYRIQNSQRFENEIDTYSSPQMYDENQGAGRYQVDGRRSQSGGDPEAKPSDDTSAFYDESFKPESSKLRLFGYDIFKINDEAFNPGIHDLPPDGYTFGPGDNILVNVWGRVDLELTLTVDREGKVFIPKVGEVIAAGAGLDEFKRRLNTKLSQVYSDYNLSVSYGKLRQITIYVFGEVKKPGGYAISSLANLLHALYIAGGITEKGSLRNIQIIRNTRIAGSYDLYDLLLKGDSSPDLKLYSGDVVYVPVTGPLISISGEVKRPAIYELKGGELINDALELAGGSTPISYLESISLDRVGPSDSRLLLDINLADTAAFTANNIQLKDGDKLKVFSIYDFHDNLVYLNGHVKHPGLFGLTDSMRISGLIDNGEQLKENVYTERADLYRINGDGTKTLIPIELDKILALDNQCDLLLEPRDSVVIYSFDKVTREKFVHIAGEIKKPGSYKLYESMKLSDLIFLAGNLTRQASLVRCEIARSLVGEKTEIIRVNLEDLLSGRMKERDVELTEDDHVFIRQVPEWHPVHTVTIDGEVMFPGEYAIRREDERLSDIIGRAGGLSLSAFPEGCIYIRRTIEDQVKQRNIGQIIENTREYRLDSLGNISTDDQMKYDPTSLNRLIIDLPAILKDPYGKYDIIVENSDYIFIPACPSGIQVIGSVAFNGTISYVRGKKADFYIAQSGGLSPNGDKKGIRLVKANGKVFYGNKAKKQTIELGDAIVVPSKLKHKTDWGKIFSTTATIVSSMATTILIVDRLK